MTLKTVYDEETGTVDQKSTKIGHVDSYRNFRHTKLSSQNFCHTVLRQVQWHNRIFLVTGTSLANFSINSDV